MNTQQYGENEIQEVRNLAHLPIREIARLTGKTYNQIIYIKAKYNIHKQYLNK